MEEYKVDRRKRNKSELSLTPSLLSQNPRKILKMAEENMDIMATSAEMPSDWSSLSDSEKLDKLMLKLLNMDKNVDSFIKEKQSEISNSSLLLKVSSLEGKNIRLEKQVERLNKKVEDLEWRDMRENLVFYNIEEQEGENCETVITDFLKKKMNISACDIYSQANLGGEIRIDTAHHLGKRNTSQASRPIVVKFVTRKGREMVLQHGKNLKGMKYFVREQMPSVMRERRQAQNDRLKELRQHHPDRSTNRIHFVKDKLLHNGKVVPAPFEYNVLPDIPAIPLEYDELCHSEPIVFHGSIFQGHAMNVQTVEDAVSARNALFQNTAVAAAEHIMYAYRIDTYDGIFEMGNSDDGECKGSDILVRLLERQEKDNVFLAVSRVHHGGNLGQKRFDLIKQAGEEVISLLE